MPGAHQTDARKVVVVTGGSRGIGAATATLAATEGYAVVVAYHARRDAAEQVVAEIGSHGGDALAVQADVSQEADVVRLFERIDDHYGRLDALVNNAGVLAHQGGLDTMTADRISRILATNVTGALICIREAARRMSTQNGGDGGAIVNVSSMASRLGSPGEYVDYAASKGALDTITIGLSKELAPQGIRVNAVRPGFTYTDIHASGGEPDRVNRLKTRVPMQRGAEPIEVARPIVWLLSDAASFTTGALLDVTGGM